MNLVGTLETQIEVMKMEKIVNVFCVKMRFSVIGGIARKQTRLKQIAKEQILIKKVLEKQKSDNLKKVRLDKK